MKKITRLILLIVAIVAWGSVANAQNTECAGTSTVSTQADLFTNGYNYTFTTTGTDVTITFELLDTKVGLVAYLWNQTSGFAELPMTATTGQKFTKTLTGLTLGSVINVACKFAYAGGQGMAVTSSFNYTVGNSCVVGPPDTEIPAAFTATKGAVTANSVELLLNGTDNSGAVTYTIAYGTTTLTTSSNSGIQKSYIVTGLTPSTAYSFSVSAKDASNNQAANNPIVIPATTSALPAPTVAAPTPPAYSAPKVISIFSDAYTPIPGTINLNPGWGQATQMTTVQVAGNSTIKYANLNYQGTDFGSDVNVVPMAYLHVDVWSADETSLQFFLINHAPQSEKSVPLIPLNLNAWNSYDIPLTSFTSQGLLLTNIYQFKVVGSGGKTVYLDNMYFYDPSADVDAQAPTAFTATKGVVASDAVELLLNATDNSGAVTYTITYGAGPIVLTTSGVSGTQKSYTVTGLAGSTDYSFSVVAKDATGNISTNSPIVVTATTLAPVAAAPVPTYNASKVISIYSDTYTNVMNANGWENWYGNTFSGVSLGGNATLKDIATCCLGASFTTPTINVSSMTYLHVDIYPITSTTMTLGFIAATTTTGTVTPQKALTFTTGQWNSIDISMSELKTSFPTADFTQAKQISISPANGTFYLDNLLFYNDGTTAISDVITENNISCYPNPITNTVTVSSKTEISQMIVRNLLGQTVNSTYIHGLSKTIDLSDVASGNYFITLKLANGQISTQKIVKL
ncbi:MAG: T9SS type A sorting domain-containing protein [Paludibacter sp.]|nr:T9SS type A sorting domain-containing protein [Paludibacter sp.]